MEKIHEQIQYIEFVSPDLKQIRKFYEQAFGWEFTDYGGDYTAFSGDNIEGGFAPGEVKPGSVLVVLYSNTLEETQAKLEAAGGKVVQEIFSFPGGRRFHFTDVDGNELAVWSDK